MCSALIVPPAFLPSSLWGGSGRLGCHLSTRVPCQLLTRWQCPSPASRPAKASQQAGEGLGLLAGNTASGGSDEDNAGAGTAGDGGAGEQTGNWKLGGFLTAECRGWHDGKGAASFQGRLAGMVRRGSRGRAWRLPGYSQAAGQQVLGLPGLPQVGSGLSVLPAGSKDV